MRIEHLAFYLSFFVLSVFAAKLFSTLFSAMILMYMTIQWGNDIHKQSNRKNPADYENDE